MSGGLSWWWLASIPVMVAIVNGATAAISRLFVSPAEKLTAEVSGFTAEVSHMREELASTRARLDGLEQRHSRETYRSSRKGRIAHLALDRVEDKDAYIARRDSTLAHHDPDHQLVWVPEQPARLADPDWVSRRRAELLALDDDDDDDEPRIRNPP